MKISCLLLLALLLTGCTSPPPGGSLTADQAGTVALQLANDKASTLYHCRPFQDGSPARLAAGRWVWKQRKGYGQGDYQATVELAANGSTNNVEVFLLDNRVY